MALDEKRRQKKLAKKAAERKARQTSKSALMRTDSATRAVQFPSFGEGMPIGPSRSLLQLSYEITEEPLEETAYAQLPPAAKEEFNELHAYLHADPDEVITDLERLVERYPEVPQAYNFLQAAYTLAGDKSNARRVGDEILKRFPNYLFGRLALASDYLDQGELERIPEIFENKYDLKLLYPERERFHISEVLHFDAIMARYFHALGENDRAEVYYKILNQLDPHHTTTKMIHRLLHPADTSGIKDLLRKLVVKR